MSEIAMTNQASPGALGANLSALFFNLSGQPCYVGNDGVPHILLEDPGTFGNMVVTGTLTSNGVLSASGDVRVSSGSNLVAGNATVNAMSGRVTAAIGQTLLQVNCNMVTANSHVICQPSQNDSTGRVTAVEPGSGNFRVSLAAPTANMTLDFFVLNPA